MIKNIMDLVREKYYSDFTFPNSFNLYAETFNTHSDTSFYFFCIYLLKLSRRELLPPLVDSSGNMISNLNNSDINIENEKKNKLINIYLQSKKIKNCLIRFLKIIKEKKNINYEFNDDLQFIPLKNYDKSEIIVINQNNTNYKFRLLDLIKLWKIALYNSQNMFPQPIKLKNPFTNIEFSNSSLFNIFYKYQKGKYVVPEIILLFYKTNFDMAQFKIIAYPLLQSNAIKSHINVAPYQDLYDYLVMLFHDYRKYTNYVILKPTATYYMKINLIKKMNKFLRYYLTYKFSCNPLLKDYNNNKIKNEINKFILKNSLNNFIYLNEAEIERYESTEIFSSSGNSLSSSIESSVDDDSIDLEANNTIRTTTNTTSNIYQLLDTNETDSDLESTGSSLYSNTIESPSLSNRNNNQSISNSIIYRPTNYINGDIFNNITTRNTIISRRSSIYIPPIRTSNPFVPRNEIPRSPSGRRFGLLRFN